MKATMMIDAWFPGTRYARFCTRVGDDGMTSVTRSSGSAADLRHLKTENGKWASRSVVLECQPIEGPLGNQVIVRKIRRKEMNRSNLKQGFRAFVVMGAAIAFSASLTAGAQIATPAKKVTVP